MDQDALKKLKSYVYLLPTRINPRGGMAPVDASREWEADNATHAARFWRSAAERVANATPAVSAEKAADEIMARIERDGAVHRDSLIAVLQQMGAR